MTTLPDLIHAPLDGKWDALAREALQSFVDDRYPARAKSSYAIRVNGDTSDEAAPYAALIAPGQPKSGPYGGMSVVLFPRKGGPALVSMVAGTHGLAPDEQVLGRPGHARKVAAVARWLNGRARGLRAWSKRDPVRVDQDLPQSTRKLLAGYANALGKYGREIYGAFVPAEIERLFSIFLDHASDDAFALMPGHAYFLGDDVAAPRRLRSELAPLLREYLAQGYVGGFAEEIRAYLDWIDARAEG